ncbi:MAG: hypothetical protein GX663_04695 [Clostridiales bacterium]|nr:hypothetical protein [Clostridiales bacterium]
MDYSNVEKSPVLLKEENRQFAMDPGRQMRGYAKMEKDDDKGLIVVIVDNVKFFPKGEYVYKLIFAGTKNEKRQYHMVGNISLSAYGKGEGSFRVNSHDLDGHGMALWDFSTAIIAAVSTVNPKESLHPVLKGNFSISPEKGKKIQATAKDYSPFYNKFVLDSCVSIAKMQKDFVDIFPFKKDFTEAQWKKITDCTILPMISPGSKEAMTEYGHFIFGWNDSYYFIGIPGRFLQKEQPDKGTSGFVYWQPIAGMEDREDDTALPIEERRKNTYGYWIAAINRYNGRIEEVLT